MVRTGIIGGGASGMMAAAAAAGRGAQVTILEQRDRVGKKLLATGNGKCNLSNLDFCVPRDYRSRDMQRLPSFFARFGVEDTLRFFRERGMCTVDKNGYLYPRCGQASAVLDLFREELLRLGVETVCSCRILKISKKGGRFQVATDRQPFFFDNLILSCGSPAGTKPSDHLGGYDLARSLGLSVYEPLPALTALRCRDSCFKALAGVRCMAGVGLHITGIETSLEFYEDGELQLTDYGISGIPVFQLSGYAGEALWEGKKVDAVINFLPEIPGEEWDGFCKAQYEFCLGRSAEQLGCGLVHKKIVHVLLAKCNLKPSAIVGPGNRKQIFAFLELMRRFPAEVISTNPMENAQVCMGGVALSEVDENLQAVKIPGLYLCGEMLDVDGRCGGYNLQWAWTSGFLAGSAAGTTELRNGRTK